MFTIARASVDDIMCLAHLWLISDTPQDIELGAGRRISNRLISTTEHRVVQLRRADDFVAGHESHRLVRRELAATTKLLRDAACAQRQARRLLTTVGELAQLAAWIAADNNEHEATYGYVHSGVLAARAACDAPNDPDWVYWLNRDEIDVMAGRCYTELKIPYRAEPLLREAINRYDKTLIRENILYLSWLAESYVEFDDIEQAASVALQAAQLAAHSGSARADDRLRHVAQLLQPFGSVSQVAEFLDFYRDHRDQE